MKLTQAQRDRAYEEYVRTTNPVLQSQAYLFVVELIKNKYKNEIYGSIVDNYAEQKFGRIIQESVDELVKKYPTVTEFKDRSQYFFLAEIFKGDAQVIPSPEFQKLSEGNSSVKMPLPPVNPETLEPMLEAIYKKMEFELEIQSESPEEAIQNMKRIKDGVYVVRTQAGFKRAVKTYLGYCPEHDYIRNYPTQYPALVVLNEGYQGYHYLEVSVLHFNELHEILKDD